jgi:hypothetical protein
VASSRADDLVELGAGTAAAGPSRVAAAVIARATQLAVLLRGAQ